MRQANSALSKSSLQSRSAISSPPSRTSSFQSDASLFNHTRDSLTPAAILVHMSDPDTFSLACKQDMNGRSSVTLDRDRNITNTSDFVVPSAGKTFVPPSQLTRSCLPELGDCASDDEKNFASTFDAQNHERNSSSCVSSNTLRLAHDFVPDFDIRPRCASNVMESCTPTSTHTANGSDENTLSPSPVLHGNDQ